MKLTVLLMTACRASFAIAAVKPTTSNCGSNNCVRAVTGTQRGLPAQSSAKQDCSSFLRATVYPATVTSTSTVTVFPVTATSTSSSTTTTVFQTTIVSTSYVVASTETDSTIVGTLTVPAKRAVAAALTTGTVKPNSVPAYASPCSGTVLYSSACSCFGVTATTTTLATPTTWSTVTVSATASTTFVSLVAYTSTISQTIISSVTTTTIASLTSTVVAAPMPTFDAYCANGKGASGALGQCDMGDCQLYHLRIEGVNDTPYEGLIRSGPSMVTTPSGGTHLCDGTNNAANSIAGGTDTTALQSAGGVCGFGFDGTYSNQLEDFFIESIGATTQTATQFWGLLENYAFTPAGGCQTEPDTAIEILWAFDAFNANAFLRVDPPAVRLSVGQSHVFTVTASDGSGGTLSPLSGAVFNGLVSDADGNVVYLATAPGTYRIKATRGGAIRSNAAIITVTA